MCRARTKRFLNFSSGCVEGKCTVSHRTDNSSAIFTIYANKQSHSSARRPRLPLSSLHCQHVIIQHIAKRQKIESARDPCSKTITVQHISTEALGNRNTPSESNQMKHVVFYLVGKPPAKKTTKRMITTLNRYKHCRKRAHQRRRAENQPGHCLHASSLLSIQHSLSHILGNAHSSAHTLFQKNRAQYNPFSAQSKALCSPTSLLYRARGGITTASDASSHRARGGLTTASHACSCDPRNKTSPVASSLVPN